MSFLNKVTTGAKDLALKVKDSVLPPPEKAFCSECEADDGYHFAKCTQEPKKMNPAQVAKQFGKEVFTQFVVKEGGAILKSAVTGKVRGWWRKVIGTTLGTPQMPKYPVYDESHYDHNED